MMKYHTLCKLIIEYSLISKYFQREMSMVFSEMLRKCMTLKFNEKVQVFSRRPEICSKLYLFQE